VSATVLCSACGHANGPEARFCNRCGVQLGRRASPISVAVPAPPPAVGSTVTHVGRAYALGYDESSFAVTPAKGGPPVARFERTEQGWRRAWDRFQRLERRDAVPAWRQRTAPWILLNVAISLAVWCVIIIVDGMVLAAAGRDTEELSTSMLVGDVVALPLTIAGWMLFAYASNAARRRLALTILVGGAFALSVVMALIGQPDA
jgi:hypothetical protein